MAIVATVAPGTRKGLPLPVNPQPQQSIMLFSSKIYKIQMSNTTNLFTFRPAAVSVAIKGSLRLCSSSTQFTEEEKSMPTIEACFTTKHHR